MSKEIISLYDNVMQELSSEKRPGTIRSKKGVMVEDLCKLSILTAWSQLGADRNRLTIDSKKIRILPLIEGISRFPLAVREAVTSDSVFANIGIDVHVRIDNKFVLGVECKSYTENAMLKRILVDFILLKIAHPQLICCLLQLETFLGGENNFIDDEVANHSTYTLMSHFHDIDLKILTFLSGARDIQRPIHQPEYAKSLETSRVNFVLSEFRSFLRKFV